MVTHFPMHLISVCGINLQRFCYPSSPRQLLDQCACSKKTEAESHDSCFHHLYFMSVRGQWWTQTRKNWCSVFEDPKVFLGLLNWPFAAWKLHCLAAAPLHFSALVGKPWLGPTKFGCPSHCVANNGWKMGVRLSWNMAQMLWWRPLYQAQPGPSPEPHDRDEAPCFFCEVRAIWVKKHSTQGIYTTEAFRSLVNCRLVKSLVINLCT